MNQTASRRVPSSQSLIGALVVLVGVLLLFQTTGVVATGDVLVYVPSVFVLAGVWALVQSGFRSIVGPVVLIGVASAVQLVWLELATVEELLVFWPVLVIAFGLSIVLGRFRSNVTETTDVRTTAFAAFGGVETRNTSKTFTGGDLTALFGGTELDLRDAEIEDRPATVNAVAMFGGVEIIVPRDWNVRMDVIPILGGAADDRPRRETEHESVDLVVTGFAAFGGISITD